VRRGNADIALVCRCDGHAFDVNDVDAVCDARHNHATRQFAATRCGGARRPRRCR